MPWCVRPLFDLGNIAETGTTTPTFGAGTMFFGAATQQEKAFRLLDVAAEGGITFFDTAEMYPVPQSSSQQGMSEIVLGKWLQGQNRSGVQPGQPAV